MRAVELRGGCPDETPPPKLRPVSGPRALLDLPVYSRLPRRADSVIAVSQKEWLDAVEAGLVKGAPEVPAKDADDLDRSG